MDMETPTNSTDVSQENEKKRSPLLIIILILLLLLMGCCILGVIFCRGSSRLPDLIDRFTDYDFDPDSDLDFDDFWGLVNEFGDLEKTKTPVYLDPGEEPETGPSICDGLSGNFEMQVLVGPAEVVGLEPFGIGSIPFAVELDGGTYLVHGEGAIDFEDVLEEEWGTYTVFFDMDGVIDGVCTQNDGGGVLDITIEVTGDQVFIVDSPGLHEEYPWSGTHEFDFTFPVEDGAIESGEGWALVLHLD
jgi:hypothetical protein